MAKGLLWRRTKSEVSKKQKNNLDDTGSETDIIPFPQDENKKHQNRKPKSKETDITSNSNEITNKTDAETELKDCNGSESSKAAIKLLKNCTEDSNGNQSNGDESKIKTEIVDENQLEFVEEVIGKVAEEEYLFPEEIDTSELMKEELQAILDSSSITNPTNIKASVNCNYFSPEITVKKHDVVRLSYLQGDFVYIKNKKGAGGFIPLNYCAIDYKENSGSKKRKDSKKDKKKQIIENKVDILKKEKTKKNDNKGNETKLSKNDKQIANKQNGNKQTKSTFYVNEKTSLSYNSSQETQQTLPNNKIEAAQPLEVLHEVQINMSKLQEQTEEPVTERTEESVTEETTNVDNKDHSVVVNDNDIKQNMVDLEAKDKVSLTDDLIDSEISIDFNLEDDTDDNLNERLYITEGLKKSLAKLKTVQQQIKSVDNVKEKSEKQESGFSEISDSTVEDVQTENRNQIKRALTKKVEGKEKASKKISESTKLKIKEFLLKKKSKHVKESTTKERTTQIKGLFSKGNMALSKVGKWSESRIDWYSNLFDDTISDSSEEEDDDNASTSTDASSMNKRTRINFEAERRDFIDKFCKRRTSGTSINSVSSEYFKPLRGRSGTSESVLDPTMEEELSSPACSLNIDHANSKRETNIDTSNSGYATILKIDHWKTTALNNGDKIDSGNLRHGESSVSGSETLEEGLYPPLIEHRASNRPSSRPASSLSHYTRQLSLPERPSSSLSYAKSLDERLVPPHPNEMKSKNIMLVSYDFIAAEAEEVTILSGQQVEVLDKPDVDWWLVRTIDGRQGIAPRTFLAPVPTVPIRKPDLLRKLHSSSDTDTDQNNNKPVEQRMKAPVHLPSKSDSAESPRLAKVAPYIHESEENPNLSDSIYTTTDDFQLYKKQVQSLYNHPPPSYNQYILHKQHLKLMDTFYESASEVECQGPPSRDWKSQEQMKYIDIEYSEPPPRLVRRKSFSGRQKKVRFSNEVERHGYHKKAEDFYIAGTYGLDCTQVGEEESQIATWC